MEQIDLVKLDLSKLKYNYDYFELGDSEKALLMDLINLVPHIGVRADIDLFQKVYKKLNKKKKTPPDKQYLKAVLTDSEDWFRLKGDEIVFVPALEAINKIEKQKEQNRNRQQRFRDRKKNKNKYDDYDKEIGNLDMNKV